MATFAAPRLEASPDLAQPATVNTSHRLLRRLGRSRKGVAGGCLVGVLLLMAAVGPLIAPHDPLDQDYDAVLSLPSLAHPLGTDELGRDTLSRLLYGARVAVEVGVLTVAFATIAGAAIGLASAEFRGVTDLVAMRLMDSLMAFPSILLALGLLAVLGPSLRNVIVAIALGNIPKFARLVRGEALSIQSADYVLAARVTGASSWRVIFRHLWPNAIDAVIVQVSLTIGVAIIMEASLSFLGVGVQPPTPTWGWMLKSGYPFIQTAPLLPLVPGMAIFLAVLGFNLLGDSVRDALDPSVAQSLAEG